MGVTVKFRTVVLTVLGVFSAVSVLILSDGVRRGIGHGIKLCETSVVPSLFLFTAVTLFLSYSGGCRVLGRVISPITKPLLGLKDVCSSVFLMSLISGYPVGAKVLSAEFKKGSVDRGSALKMLTFSVNAGPSFIVTAVGFGVLKSNADGWRLYMAHVLASIIMAGVVRFLPDSWFDKYKQSSTVTADSPTDKLSNSVTTPTVGDAFVLSVNDAAKTMLTVAAFVVFFAGVGGMFGSSGFGQYIREILEVTVGVGGCSRGQLPKVAFLLGFGGISVIFQVISAAKDLKPPLLLVVVSRVLHGTLSAGLILLFEVISPRTLSTGAFQITKNAALHTSPIASAGLLFLCVVLISFTKTALGKKANSQTSL